MNDLDTLRADRPTVLTIPSLKELGRRALPQLLEGVLIPLGLFLVVMHVANVALAIIVALGWSGAVILRRILQRRRVPGIVIVGAMMLVCRSIVALATGSAFLYFVQPILGAACVAAAFLLSVVAGRPLARRFAADYCSIPGSLLADARVHSFMLRVSLMWAAVGFVNAGITLWLLVSQPTASYLVAKAAVSISATVVPVAISVLWFRRCMTRHGLLAPPPNAAAAAVAVPTALRCRRRAGRDRRDADRQVASRSGGELGRNAHRPGDNFGDQASRYPLSHSS
jgi:hypothetical protein